VRYAGYNRRGRLLGMLAQVPRPVRRQGLRAAQEVLERIGTLYDSEAGIRGHSPAERQAVRQARAGRVLEKLRQWLDMTLRRVPGRSALAAAIRYARSRWTLLCRYREDFVATVRAAG
jgi:hypothetical protein